jgi:hypothetical protein
MYPCSAPAPAPGMDYFGGPAPPPQQQYAALPPSTSNGYNADPWGSTSVGGGSYATAPSPAGAPPATYRPPAPAPAYGGQPADPFEAQQAYGAPPANSYYGAPAPTHDYSTQPTANPFSAPAQPAYGPPETPTGAMVPGGQNFTPTTQASTLGFASPVENNAPARDPFAAPAQDQFGGPAQDQYGGPAQDQFGGPAQDPFAAPPAPAPEQFPAAGSPPAAANEPALLSMNVLSGQQQRLVSDDMTSGGAGGTVADQAYAKLMNMNAFDLVKGKDEQERANPFDMGTNSNSMNNQSSLSDMKKKSSSVSGNDEQITCAPKNERKTHIFSFILYYRDKRRRS